MTLTDGGTQGDGDILARREEESWGRDEGNNKQTGWKQIKLLLPNATSHVDVCSVEGRLKFCQITYNKGYEIFEDLCCHVWFVCNSSHSSNEMRDEVPLPSTSFITLQGSGDDSFKTLHIHPAKLQSAAFLDNLSRVSPISIL